jgi:hypothetical protein
VLAHHALGGAMVSGDRLAFSVGAVSVAAGALLALVLLGRRTARQMQPGPTVEPSLTVNQPAEQPELELAA